MFAAVRVDQTNGTIDGWTEQEIIDLGAADSAEYTAALTKAQAVFGDEYAAIEEGDVKLLMVISLLLARLVLWRV